MQYYQNTVLSECSIIRIQCYQNTVLSEYSIIRMLWSRCVNLAQTFSSSPEMFNPINKNTALSECYCIEWSSCASLNQIVKKISQLNITKCNLNFIHYFDLFEFVYFGFMVSWPTNQMLLPMKPF